MQQQLIAALRRRIDVHAHRAVHRSLDEVPELRAVFGDAGSVTEMLDFAVSIRRRALELAREDAPLTQDDLRAVTALGEERADGGLSFDSARAVLGVHMSVALQELHEAAGPRDGEALAHMVHWLGGQVETVQQAYLTGFLSGQRRARRLSARLRLLTGMLVDDDPGLEAMADAVHVPVHDRYLVLVVRVAPTPATTEAQRDDAVEALFARRRLAMSWAEPEELVVMVPDRHASASVSDDVREVASDVVSATGRFCAPAVAAAGRGGLGDGVRLARRISRAAPLHPAPGSVYGLADVFVELAVGELPEAERWISDLRRALSRGPDLVRTLDAYFRNDMRRADTAADLNVHPRTLDYRLRRVRDLTGIDPSTALGVRALSVAVARTLVDG